MCFNIHIITNQSNITKITFRLKLFPTLICFKQIITVEVLNSSEEIFSSLFRIHISYLIIMWPNKFIQFCLSCFNSQIKYSCIVKYVRIEISPPVNVLHMKYLHLLNILHMEHFKYLHCYIFFTWHNWNISTC